MRVYKCDNCRCKPCYLFDISGTAAPTNCAYHDISEWKEIDIEDAMNAIQMRM